MQHFKIDLYEYFGIEKVGNGGILTTYIPDAVDGIDKKIRPAMLVLPGGAYFGCSEREKEPVALKFMSCGYASFTLEYATQTAYPIPLSEALMAVSYLRENAVMFGISKIAVVGFSAGGHLAGLLATATETEAKTILNKKIKFYCPDAAVLCYPVVTLRDGVTHFDTRKYITGDNKKLYERLSVENRITKDSAPLFIWHTAEDDCVFVENSLMLASACKNVGVPFALHIFEKGWHGMSLCCSETDNRTSDEVALDYVSKWVDLTLDWLSARGFTVVVKN